MEWLIPIIIILSIVSVLISTFVILFKKQKEQNKKIEELNKLLKQNKDGVFKVKDGMTQEDINVIDPSIDVNSLMEDLYNKFLKVLNGITNLEDDFTSVATDKVNTIYVSKINTLKMINNREVTENINLLGYSITNFSLDKLIFRVSISSLYYKQNKDGIIISGSNAQPVKQIFSITYIKEDNEWLLDDIDKIYEKTE